MKDRYGNAHEGYIYIYIYIVQLPMKVCVVFVMIKPMVAHVFLQKCELSFNSFQLNVMCDVTIESID